MYLELQINYISEIKVSPKKKDCKYNFITVFLKLLVSVNPVNGSSRNFLCKKLLELIINLKN